MSGRTPYPAIAERPLPDKFGAGMSWMPRWTPDGLAVDSFTHTMLGWLWSTDGYFRLMSTLAATDYGIGGSGDGAYDGVIFRWINYQVRRNTAGWASGWSVAPDFTQKGQALVKKFGTSAINGTGRSVELSGLLNTPITAKQWAAYLHLVAAIHHNECNQGYEEVAWIMEHADVAEKDCAFPRWRNYRDEAIEGITLIMKRYETGKDIPDFLMFGDLKVMLAGGADIIPPYEPEPGKPIMVAFPDEIRFTTRRGALSRQWALRSAKVVRRYPQDTPLRCVGYYFGEEVDGDDRWLVITSPGPSNNARIHVSGVREQIPDPGLPALEAA